MFAHGLLQAVVYDDASTDDSVHVVQQWAKRHAEDVHVKLLEGLRLGQTGARGAGFGRNQCVAAASGEFVCMLDSDDVMEPNRVSRQLAALLEAERGPITGALARYAARSTLPPVALDGGVSGCASAAIGLEPASKRTSASSSAPEASDRPEMILVGSRVTRMPAESTPRYTQWINQSPQTELWLQQYREVSLVQPTWFLRRSAFVAVGGYGVEMPVAAATRASPTTSAPAATEETTGALSRPSKATMKRRAKLSAAMAQGLVKRPHATVAGLDSAVCLPGMVHAEALRVQCAGLAAFNAYCRAHFEARIRQAKVVKRSAPALHVTASPPPAPGKRCRPASPAPIDTAGTGEAAGSPLAAASSSGGRGSAPSGSPAAAAAPTIAGVSTAEAMHRGSTRVQFPEDLLFILAFAAAGGAFLRVDASLLRYRCTPGSVSWNIPRKALLAVKTGAFEVRELGLQGPLPASAGGSVGARWEFLDSGSQDLAKRCLEAVSGGSTMARGVPSPLAAGFSVWGCGRDGAQFLSSLSPEGLNLVRCCGDIDPKKVAAGKVRVCPVTAGSAAVTVPVVSVEEMPPPMVTCVAMNRGGEFEARLGAWMARHGAVRGLDVWHVV